MYELTYIINPNLTETEVSAQADKVRGFINAQGGEIKNERLGDKRRLAFPIGKHGYGFYVTAEFNAEPEKIAEIDRQLRLEPQIVRHLLISREVIVETPRKIRLPRKEKAEATTKDTVSEAAQEKASIEEIDKKLEELLEQ